MAFLASQEITVASLWTAAIDFSDGASRLADGNQPIPIRAFGQTAGYAIELTLKVFLLHTGSDEDELKKFGHDLSALWHECVKRGLRIEEVAPRWVQAVNSPHNAPYTYRYPKANQGLMVPDPFGVAAMIRELQSKVSHEIKRDRAGNAI